MIIPGMRTPPADAEKPVTDNYIKAVNLNSKIIAAAYYAQQSLYEMCMGFKEMRDSKLYKELGYQSFEEYCEKETSVKKVQVYKYISVAENLPEEFVHSSVRIGPTKMFLLSKLSEDDRNQITENCDLDNISVRELEKQVTKLKLEKEKAEEDCENLEAEYKGKVSSLEKSKKQLSDKITDLENEIKELESRPIEASFSDPKENDRLVKETIKSLERENIKKNEELEAQYRADEKAVRKMLEKEKEEALKRLEAEKQQKIDSLKAELKSVQEEYEKKLAEKKTTEPDAGKETYKAYFSTAYDSFNRLIEFTKKQGNELFINKTNELINTLKNTLER